MIALNIGTGIIPHQKKNIMPDNDLRPEKKNGQRNGYWFVSYRENKYDETDMGWCGHYVNDELMGYFEDLGPENRVVNKEYYAK